MKYSKGHRLHLFFSENSRTEEKEYRLEIDLSNKNKASFSTSKEGLCNLRKMIDEVLQEDTEVGEGCTLFKDGTSPNFPEN